MPVDAGRVRRLTALIGMILLLPFTGALAEDCGAQFDVSIENEEESDARREIDFSVEISIASDCAVVRYELVIETQALDGNMKTEKKPGRIELHGQGEMSQGHRFSMPLDDQLSSYEARLVGCDGC